MKKMLIFFIAVSIFSLKCLESIAAIGDIVLVEKVTTGGERLWGSNPTFPCPFEGTDCKVSVKEKTSCDIEAVNSGYLLTITIDEIKFTNVLTLATIHSQVALSNIYDGEFAVRINNCPEYPVLNGITVDIPNTIIDEDKKNHVFIPLINN